MKKNKLTMACVYLLSSSILLSSCIGSFSLFNRLLTWNRNIDNKFVNELVFVALNIVPVYLVSGLADILVLNSIEFWTGDNPVANVGDIKKIKGENSDYIVEVTENGYTISNGEESMELIFNKDSSTWSVAADGVSSDLIKIHTDGTADLYLPNQTSVNVTLDNQGISMARQISMNNVFFASR